MEGNNDDDEILNYITRINKERKDNNKMSANLCQKNLNTMMMVSNESINI